MGDHHHVPAHRKEDGLVSVLELHSVQGKSLGSNTEMDILIEGQIMNSLRTVLNVNKLKNLLMFSLA